MRLVERPKDGSLPDPAPKPSASGDLRTGRLRDEAKDWNPKGDELVAKSNLVEIDELNPSGQGIRLASSLAAQGVASLVVGGLLERQDSDVTVSLARFARDAVREDGVDIEKLKAELASSRLPGSS